MPRPKKDPVPPALRWQVWGRDDFACHYCGAKGVPLSVDHKVPESKGGKTEPDNLISACGPCNQRKGVLSYGEFLERLKNPEIAFERVEIPAVDAEGRRVFYRSRLGVLSVLNSAWYIEHSLSRKRMTKNFVRYARYLLSRHGRKISDFLFYNVCDDIVSYYDKHLMERIDPVTGEMRWDYKSFKFLTIEDWEYAIRDGMRRVDVSGERLAEICRLAHQAYGEALLRRFDFPLPIGEPLDMYTVTGINPRTGKKERMYVALSLANFEERVQLVKDYLGRSEYFHSEAKRIYDDSCLVFGRKFQRLFQFD